MIEQIQNPYTFWHQQLFTKTKDIILPPKSKRLTYQQASTFKFYAVSHFNKEKVDANEIRLRKPPGKIADIDSLINKSYESIKIQSGDFDLNNLYATPGSGSSYQFKFLAYKIKNKKYNEVIGLVEPLIMRYPNMIIFPLYGYLSAISISSEINENTFFRAIERMCCDIKDVDHHYHLFDELCALSTTYTNPLLLHLLIGCVTNAIEELNRTTHIFPVLTTNKPNIQNPFYFVPYIGSRVSFPIGKTFEDLKTQKQKAISQMPPLVSASNDIISPQKQRK